MRPLTSDDLPGVARLSKEIYRTSRVGETAWALERGFGPVVRESGGKITGYLIPSLVGHGVIFS